MFDYSEGIKKDVAEIKFLIHDLRVEHFINEVIHYHVTVNTDLEIYSVEQARVLHGADLEELKAKAVNLRKAYRDYSNAVKNFAPDKTVLLLGTRYVESIRDVCELILNPRWGRTDRVLPFLPEASHSYQARSHYRNCIRWIGGVYYRIHFFVEEQRGEELREEFEVGQEVHDFIRNVVYGYVVEKGQARVELQVERLDTAVLGGNRHRFRRMVFNLVMNAVDALAGLKVGVINVSETVEDDHVLLCVRDNGAGMTQAKIRNLLKEKETLDGELHSLGFVFVRRTIEEFGGTLSVESEFGKGTTITVRLPRLEGKRASVRASSPFEKYDLPWDDEASLAIAQPGEPGAGRPVAAAAPPPNDPAFPELEAADQLSAVQPVPAPEPNVESSPRSSDAKQYGQLVVEDFRTSQAQYPGALFAIAVTEEGRVDYFTHRPYERQWNISHEDLSPTFFQATVRGRLEQDDEKRLVLILKEPQITQEYFEFKETDPGDRSIERFLAMVHDEYIRIARVLVSTGFPAETGVLMTGTEKFFPDDGQSFVEEPFPLRSLVDLPLIVEREGWHTDDAGVPSGPTVSGAARDHRVE